MTPESLGYNLEHVSPGTQPAIPCAFQDRIWSSETNVGIIGELTQEHGISILVHWRNLTQEEKENP